MRFKKYLNEALEVTFQELSTTDQDFINQIVKIFKGHTGLDTNIKNMTFWDGIHGKIVDIPIKGSLRLPKKEVQKLIKLYPFRWMEDSNGSFIIGF